MTRLGLKAAFRYGEKLTAFKSMEEAEKYFIKALDLKDTMVDSKYHLGLIYENWGKLEAAAEYFAAAHQSAINGMNTVTREAVDEKFYEYWGDGDAPRASVGAASHDTKNIGTDKAAEPDDEDDLDDIETEER